MKIIIILFSLFSLFGCAQQKQKIVKPKYREVHQNIPSSNYYMFGEQMLNSGKIESAVIAFERAVKYDDQSEYLKHRYIDVLRFAALNSAESEKYHNQIIENANSFIEQGIHTERTFEILNQSYIHQDKLDESKQLIEKALKIYKKKGDFYFLKFLLFDDKDFELLEKTRKFWNDNPNGLIKLATTYQEYNASDKVKEIVEYLEENYLTQQTISFLFRYYLENGNYLKVETILQTCIDEKINLNEKFWDTYFNLLYFGKQDYKTITKYAYTIVSENYTSLFPFLLDSFLMTEQIDSAINMGQKILQIEGFLEEVGVDDMNSLLATLFFSKRDFKESAYYLSKMKSNYSMVKAFQQKIIFRNMLDIDENDLSIYDKYFIELAQKVSPPVLNLLKVNLYGFYDKKELQREFLTKIDSTDFEDVNIYANIAISYLGLNEVEIAKSYLKKTEDKDKISQVLFDYFKKDDWEKAKKFIIDDFNNGNKTAEMYKRVSRIYQTEKNRDHELEILTKSIKKYPEDSSLLNWLGYSIANYEITERYEEAEKFLLKSIEISPGNQHIYDSIAWLYFKMGRTDDANEYMKKILLDDINSSVLAFHIAEIYNKMDMKFRAKQYYELTLELNNDDDVVNKVKEILNIKE